MALAARLTGKPHRVVVLSSDGEQQEGSTWESAMFAAHHRLDNLVLLIDLNRTQADGDLGAVLEVEPLAAKWRAFGWRVQEVDGNDLAAVAAALLATEAPSGAATEAPAGAPNVIVCRTRLGAGVPLIENKERAHFVRVAEDEWALAALELEATR
jgi:transketolase